MLGITSEKEKTRDKFKVRIKYDQDHSSSESWKWMSLQLRPGSANCPASPWASLNLCLLIHQVEPSFHGDGRDQMRWARIGVWFGLACSQHRVNESSRSRSLPVHWENPGGVEGRLGAALPGHLRGRGHLCELLSPLILCGLLFPAKA